MTEHEEQDLPHNPGEPQFGDGEGGKHNPGEPKFGDADEPADADEAAEFAEGHS